MYIRTSTLLHQADRLRDELNQLEAERQEILGGKGQKWYKSGPNKDLLEDVDRRIAAKQAEIQRIESEIEELQKQALGTSPQAPAPTTPQAQATAQAAGRTPTLPVGTIYIDARDGKRYRKEAE